MYIRRRAVHRHHKTAYSLIWPRKPISVGIFYVDIDWEKVPVSAAEVEPAEEAKGKKNRKSKGKKGKSGKGGKQKRR